VPYLTAPIEKLVVLHIIYFTYNSVNTTIKDYRFVYSYMFRLDWLIFTL